MSNKAVVSTRVITRFLESVGWHRVHGNGGHGQFTHDTQPGRVTIPNPDSSDSMPEGTLKRVFSQAHLEKVCHMLLHGQTQGNPEKFLHKVAPQLAYNS